MKGKAKKWDILLPGDEIKIIAPASGTHEEKIQQGMSWLKKIDLNPHLPENAVRTDLFFAAPLKDQWEYLKEALYSDAKVIWCLRGGYGSMRLIPFLEKIRPPKKPKLLIGFSDITSLHLYFNQKWNWPTLHGRTVTQLHPDWPLIQEHQDLVDLLFGRISELRYNGLQALNDHAKKIKTIKAPLTGGNLRILQSSLGTKCELNAAGKMVLIEDVDERGYSVDRMLEQLFQTGILNNKVKALLIGDFTEGLEKNGQNLVPDALKRFAAKVPYPVLTGLPCGHAKGVNAPLPFNTPAILTLGNDSFLTVKTNN